MVLFEKHGMEGEEFFHFFPLKNYSFPLHFHRAYEMIYVNDGQLYVSIDQKEYLLKENDLVFIFTNQMHEFKTIDYSDITIILFSPELIGDFFMNLKGLIPNDSALHLERAIDFSKLNSIYSQKSFLYAVCADLINQKSFTLVKQSPQTKVLYKMLLYVEENYSTDCTLKDIAKYLQYDYPYLSKLFAQQMNMTFTDYLNHYRISQACYLLKNSQQAIGEVAIKCGYNNLRTFHRNFKEITRRAPREYRAMD
ncbi:helix-turn-helix transcriptional regulator [Paenibacillus polymyxa]|uniref:AraC family transcriptional regulator n=1 Tax=Paenibacillus polymyxa TaxID=1406 RepID=A0AAP3ZYL5_PAEPO|nr:AraC family transcriptional regulator [Paenibacillus polymyxa]MDH2331471.1 AraC family transcriptional regulator [Paenibacillus polymyxa]